MKRIATLLLAAGMLLGAASGAAAVDFKVSGQWLVGFSVGESDLVNKQRGPGEVKHLKDSNDQFSAAQRFRLKLEAVASESLSGALYFEIGTTTWGKADGYSGALGADQTNAIKLKNAYIDWAAPDTALKFRMGLQGITMPNKAGGSAVLDSDVAGVTASYQFNDNVGLTAMWARPLNDNYSDGHNGAWQDSNGAWHADRDNYLDNMDLFGLLLPLRFDGFEATPWVMYGIKGKNSGNFDAYSNGGLGDGNPYYTLNPYPASMSAVGKTGKAYGSMFWAGLPLAVTALDPFNIELDINYGYVEAMGRYDAHRLGLDKRASTERQGWLAKALIEYKMDWATPGIFGWYASGDDGDPKNGSERMPALVSYGNFTSFLGDGNNFGWTPNGAMLDYNVSYAGTWGIGARLKDMSFVEDLKHTLTIAYFGGTNAPKMAKYMSAAYDWNHGYPENYLTTNDGLLEVNLINSWQIYENLELNLELGYVANFVDNSTWKKAGERDTSFEKQDMWKAQLIFAYTF